MPPAQDHVNVKPGGLGKTVLGERLEIVEFPDMRHGWTIRGDIAVDDIKRDVAKSACSVVDECGGDLNKTLAILIGTFDKAGQRFGIFSLTTRLSLEHAVAEHNPPSVSSAQELAASIIYFVGVYTALTLYRVPGTWTVNSKTSGAITTGDG